jgi:glycosyltransferase involved in cell wall biosynthesis
MEKPQIICLTPVKNEAWILEKFLKCASVWADRIIIADQNSDDGSPDIARRFPKVTLIENKSKVFNEPERQKMLLDEARKNPGPRLLIALDADEFLSANFFKTRDWELILRAVPGTVIKFQWACVLPDRKSYFIYPAEFPFGFVDDGSEHIGKVIHSPRLPNPENSPYIFINGFKVLHFSTIDIERFKSKIRWYQCWDFQNGGRWDGRPINLYRWYHRDFHIPDTHIHTLPNEWVEGYKPDVNLLDITMEPYYRWDKEMIALFLEKGTKLFRKIAVWDVDWNKKYVLIYKEKPPSRLDDPRSVLDRWMHKYLENTQPYQLHFPLPRPRWKAHQERLIFKIASLFGW